MSRGQNPPECSLTVEQCTISSTATARCLGIVWSHNLSPKAPMLLTLETFQAEIGKRILNLSKHYANLFSHFPKLAHDAVSHINAEAQFPPSPPQFWPIHYQCQGVLTNQAPGPLIIQQCKFLEEVYNSNITDSIMKGGATCLKYIKKALRVADSDYIWTKVSRQLSLRALSRDISWPKLWDMARDQGIQGARSIRALLRVLAKPVFENSRCPSCDLELARESLFANHVATAHLSWSLQDLLAPWMAMTICSPRDQNWNVIMHHPPPPPPPTHSVISCICMLFFVSLTGN